MNHDISTTGKPNMFMSKSLYKEKIFSEIHTLPKDALPKVLKLLLLLKDEFIIQENTHAPVADDNVNHANTQWLLRTPSSANWAHDIISAREKRV